MRYGCEWAVGFLPTGTPKQLVTFTPGPYGHRTTLILALPPIQAAVTMGHQDKDGRAWGFWLFR